MFKNLLTIRHDEVRFAFTERAFELNTASKKEKILWNCRRNIDFFFPNHLLQIVSDGLLKGFI